MIVNWNAALAYIVVTVLFTWAIRTVLRINEIVTLLRDIKTQLEKKKP